MGQREPLGVDAVLCVRRAGQGRILYQRPLQGLAGAQRFPGDQLSEYWRGVSDDLERLRLPSGEGNRGHHQRRQQGTDDRR